MQDEPKDICCICGEEGEAGTYIDVNEVDFELLCPACANKRCYSCSLLEFEVVFGDPVYKCIHKDDIEDPKKEICEFFEDEDDE